VYPYKQVISGGSFPATCLEVPGIKFELGIVAYAGGSWSNLRSVITQPYTINKLNYLSVSNWDVYSSISGYLPYDIGAPDAGPFGFAAMPGQLVVVYFRPRPRDIDSDDVPLEGYAPAEIAYLVTAPLPPNIAVYFTVEEYDAINRGFGPRKVTTGVAVFVETQPSFVWQTGTRTIPAGTVVFLTNVGSAIGTIGIQDAHDSSRDVGSIISVLINDGRAIDSISTISVWGTLGIGSARPLVGNVFVTSALSNQYAGDFPPLSPCLSINQFLFHGPMIYGQGQAFDNKGLPGTVQSAVINSSKFKLLDTNTVVEPTSLPVFRNMSCFHF